MTAEAGARIFPNWTFGDRIRKIRSMSHLDQREFAQKLGVTPSALAAWETDRATPRNIVAMARRIETLTRIPAAWVLGLDAGPGGNGPDGESRLGESNPRPIHYKPTDSPAIRYLSQEIAA